MTSRGFTLVELLVATLLGAVLVGTGVALAAWARWSFSVEPAAMDTVRRGREGIGMLADALAGAGGTTVGDAATGLVASVPTVLPLTSLDGAPGDRFTALRVLRAVPGASGRLAIAQGSPADSLTLDTLGACPRTNAVCGFAVDDVAIVYDQRGHFDIFEVGAVWDALGRITPRGALVHAYPAGAWVTRVRADRFGVIAQADGSQTLARFTWAGATEPIVDGVVSLEIVPWGEPDSPALVDADSGDGLSSYGLAPPAPGAVDPDGVYAAGEHCLAERVIGVPRSRLATRAPDGDGLARLAPGDLGDGPWCPYEGAASAFDADLLRIRRVDLRLRVEVLSAQFRGPANGLFSRAGTAALDAPRWIADRTLFISVAVSGR